MEISQSEKILNAAYKCISIKGYANISLRQIADEAGVALSQLHYYYGNKEGLLTEVINKVMKKYFFEVEKYLKNGKTAKEKVNSLINFFKEMLVHDPGLFRLFYDFTSLALWSDSFSKQLRNLFVNLTDMIEEYILNNMYLKDFFKNYSSRDLARMILGAMFGTAIQVLLDPEEEELSHALNAIQIIFE